MTRRKWVQIDGQLVEVDPATYRPKTRVDDSALWGDRHYDGVRATDGADISSRTKHREYMKRMGLTTVDDYSETWRKAERQREDFLTRGVDGTRREDVARAMFNVFDRRR